MEEHRSTWQVWHVQAEAQRQIRAANLTTDRPDQLVDLLVAEVLNNRSMPLSSSDDGTVEPAALRRSDGSSVYTVAGAELFTSARILDAERRLVATAGRTDGRTSMRSRSTWRCSSRQPTAALDAGRPLLSDPWPPRVSGCSWRSPQPAPVKRPRYGPSQGLAGRRRSRIGFGSVCCRGCSAPSPDRCAQRHTRQTHLDPPIPEWRPAGMGFQYRPLDVGVDR